MSQNIQKKFHQKQVEFFNKELKEKVNAEISEETFCVLPFIHQSTTPSGSYRLCCRSHDIGHAKDSSMTDFFYSDRMNNIRRDFIDGKKPKECQACWDLEKNGLISLRQINNSQKLASSQDSIVAWLQKKSLPRPQTLELKLSNRCNLKCRMCSPLSSTSWLKDWDLVKSYYPNNEQEEVDKIAPRGAAMPVADFFMSKSGFLQDFKEISKNVEELEFAGGEPLIDPLHFNLLDELKPRAHLVTLKYSTNLTHLLRKPVDIIELWSKFRGVRLTVSIDGPPRLNEMIRKGSQTGKVLDNIDKLKEYHNIDLRASTCVSALNALFLAETILFFLNRGILWNSNRVRFPEFLDARILDKETRHKAIDKLKAIRFDDFKDKFSVKNLGSILRHCEDNIQWLSDDIYVDRGLQKQLNNYLNSLGESLEDYFDASCV